MASVPSRCAPDGPLSTLARSTAFGSWGATKGASTQQATTSTTNTTGMTIPGSEAAPRTNPEPLRRARIASKAAAGTLMCGHAGGADRSRCTGGRLRC
jgi:hypothetical protein